MKNEIDVHFLKDIFVNHAYSWWCCIWL